jgi:hypothetical protein
MSRQVLTLMIMLPLCGASFLFAREGRWVPVVVFASMLAVAGVTWLLKYFANDAVTNRALQKAPVVRIAEFPAAGVARVIGTVTPTEEQLVSPLTKRPCVHYHLIVEEKRVGSRNRTYWADVINEADSRDFCVSDGCGKALVSMSDAEVAVTKDGHNLSGLSGRAAPDSLEKLLSDRCLRSKDFKRGLRYTEGVIEPGERVTVMGRGRRALERERGLFDVVIHRGRHTSVLVSDDVDTVLGTFNAKRRKRRARGLCTECGYDLRGDYAGGCPECGWRRAPAER